MRFTIRKTLQLGICVLLASTLHAAELARLQNGFTIRHLRHESIGETVRLYLDESGKGFVDVPSAQIAAFEVDETPEPKSAAAPKVSISEHVNREATAQQIDPDFVASVIHSESSGNIRAVSPKGAQGLMQLMPVTAAKLGVKNSLDPGENIGGGTRYLRQLFERYHGDPVKTLAAYNAGPHRVEQYKGIPPYRETRQYVARVIRDYNRRKSVATATATKKSAPKSTIRNTAKKSSTRNRALRASIAAAVPAVSVH